MVRFSAEARDISLLHSIQTGSGIQSASYSMCTGGFLPRDKAVGAWNRPVITIKYRGQEWWMCVRSGAPTSDAKVTSRANFTSHSQRGWATVAAYMGSIRISLWRLQTKQRSTYRIYIISFISFLAVFNLFLVCNRFENKLLATQITYDVALYSTNGTW
jgi:hypothetical protein